MWLFSRCLFVFSRAGTAVVVLIRVQKYSVVFNAFEQKSRSFCVCVRPRAFLFESELEVLLWLYAPLWNPLETVDDSSAERKVAVQFR